MQESKLSAATRYNDFRGTCAIDEKEEHDFLTFIKEHGFDLERYLPLAFGVHRDTEAEEVFVYAVDREQVASSYEEIQSYMEGTGNALPVRKIVLDVTFSQAFAFIDRFAMVVPMKKSLQNVAITHDEGFVFWR